jgi:hypothetical protein
VYTCDQRAPTFSVFTEAELQDEEIEEGVWLVSNGSDVVVLVPTRLQQGGEPVSRLHFRRLSDSGGGQAEEAGAVDIPGGRLSIGAATLANSEVRILVVTEDGVGEIAIPMAGDQFLNPNLTPLPTPEFCETNMVDDGSVRNLAGSYLPSLGYAVTCASATDEMSLFVVSGDPH